jgi:serine/threonine protein kinase
MQQILSGLAHLHRVVKQVHRDIKPDNILVNRNGEVKLTDFGISKCLDATLMMCNTFVGTMNYMSLERMEGGKYSYPGDIWSLGIILLEMGSGVYPFPMSNNYIEQLEIVKTAPIEEICSNEMFSPKL